MVKGNPFTIIYFIKNYMEDTYKSTIEYEDLNLISCLVLLDFPILSVNTRKYPQVGFIFGKTEMLERTVQKFFEGSLLVEPKNYWSKIRELKSRIKSIKN